MKTSGPERVCRGADHDVLLGNAELLVDQGPHRIGDLVQRRIEQIGRDDSDRMAAVAEYHGLDVEIVPHRVARFAVRSDERDPQRRRDLDLGGPALDAA